MNFRREKRSDETHASLTDPEALLAKKGEGKESKLSYAGDAEVFRANGTAERDAALITLE